MHEEEIAKLAKAIEELARAVKAIDSDALTSNARNYASRAESLARQVRKAVG